MNTIQKQAVSEMRKLLRAHGFKLIFSSAQLLKTKEGISEGLLDDDNKTIRIAQGNKEWFLVLLHEYSHFIQLIHKTDAWKKSEELDKVFDIWKYLEGKKYPEKLSKKGIRAYIDLELEAEKYTVIAMKDFFTKERIERYIRVANSILFRYAAAEESHTWRHYKRIGEITLLKFDTKFPPNFNYYFQNMEKYKDLLEK